MSFPSSLGFRDIKLVEEKLDKGIHLFFVSIYSRKRKDS